MKVCESCDAEISSKDGDNRCESCEKKKSRNKRAAENRRAMYEAMKSLGMARVRGALGGVYYE